eukprot:gene17324-22865_t
MITRSNAAAIIASRHPQTNEMFSLGMNSIFRQWTALDLAIHHGWGGPSSLNKVNDMFNEIFELFQGPERVYKDDVSLILEDYLETFFNTICEDGSPDEVGDILVNMWRKCCDGDFTFVESIIKKENNRTDVLKASQGLDNGDAIDSDDENDGIPILEAISEDNNVMSNEDNNNDMNVIDDEDNNKPNEEGWETVTRSKNKKTNKRR